MDKSCRCAATPCARRLAVNALFATVETSPTPPARAKASAMRLIHRSSSSLALR